jgi:hypothetical protein
VSDIRGTHNLPKTKESIGKKTKTHGPPEDLAKDGGLDEVEWSEKNGELRQVKESMSSSWIHRFGNPPICCGESVVGDDPCASWVEDEIEGHSRKDDSENRPSKSVPSGAHK